MIEQVNDLIHALFIGHSAVGVVDFRFRILQFLDKKDMEQAFTGSVHDRPDEVRGWGIAQKSSKCIEARLILGLIVDDIKSIEQVDSSRVNIMGSANFHCFVALSLKNAWQMLKGIPAGEHIWITKYFNCYRFFASQ